MIEELSERIHCVGIGGAGMLPLAILLAEAGHRVSGEDDSLLPEAKTLLADRGVEVASFEEAEDRAHATVVYSSAISTEHPSFSAANLLGSKTLRRGECLAIVARAKKLIAVAGSHGKTTTTSMLVDLFKQAGIEPCFAIGCMMEGAASPAAWGDSEWLIAEIDESDGTIELFDPEWTLLLNADHDHHAHYGVEAAYLSAFRDLVSRTKSGVVLEEGLPRKLGIEGTAYRSEIIELRAKEEPNFHFAPASFGYSDIYLYIDGEESRVTTNRVGDFNAWNAAMALTIFERVNTTAWVDRIVEFRPLKRRQSCYYCGRAVRVLEDYAHHPVEIRAAISSVALGEKEKLVVVFQPHRYSRTLRLKAELAESLSQCDGLYLLEVYAASENPIEGGTGEDLFDACQSRMSNVLLCGEEALLFAKLDQEISANPVVYLFLGAGITDRLAEKWADRIAEDNQRWGKVWRRLGPVSGFATRVQSNEPLASKTTLRVGGPAERYFEPVNEAELIAALEGARSADVTVWPLGRGSNIVVPDVGVLGLVIRLNHPYWRGVRKLDSQRVYVGAGLRIKELCALACKLGMAGFEFLEGIPGSVGGALRMNAGAMGGWMFDVVESVRFVDTDGRLRDEPKAKLNIRYRCCDELLDAFALGAVLKAPGLKEHQDIRREIDVYQQKRHESQPREPSAGCIFKNPEGDAAGRLIDQCGLKGARIGGAAISDAHGNFIVNRGGATSEDVIELVKLARRVVKKEANVDLEPEALLYGATWDEVLK